MNSNISMNINNQVFDPETLSANRKAGGENYKQIKRDGLAQDKESFRKLEKAATQFEIKTKRETTILSAFSEIGKDVNRGRNVKKYTIVMFNNRAIVCKNCIHDLILRIFGGRRKGVNAEIDTLLTSKTLKYKTEAFGKRANDSNYTPETSNVEIEKGIDYYMGFRRYGVSTEGLAQFKAELDPLITKYYAYYLPKVEQMDPLLSLKLTNFLNRQS